MSIFHNSPPPPFFFVQAKWVWNMLPFRAADHGNYQWTQQTQSYQLHLHKGKLNAIYMSLCRKVLSKDHPFFGRKCCSGLGFLWTNLTLSERVCVKEIIKINLTLKVSFELVKYENLHQVRAENRQRKGGHFGCTASVVILFVSFFFRQSSLCCLTGHSQSFLMLVKTAHNYL